MVFFSFTKKLFNAEELPVVLNVDKSVMNGEIRIGKSTIMVGQQELKIHSEIPGG